MKINIWISLNRVIILICNISSNSWYVGFQRYDLCQLFRIFRIHSIIDSNSESISSTNPLHSGEYVYKFTVCLPNLCYTSVDSTNCKLFSTVVCIYWKNSAYMWNHTVQTHLFRCQGCILANREDINKGNYVPT